MNSSSSRRSEGRRRQSVTWDAPGSERLVSLMQSPFCSAGEGTWETLSRWSRVSPESLHIKLWHYPHPPHSQPECGGSLHLFLCFVFFFVLFWENFVFLAPFTVSLREVCVCVCVGGIIDVCALKKYQSFSSAAKQTNNPKKRGEKKDKVMPPSFYAITH